MNRRPGADQKFARFEELENTILEKLTNLGFSDLSKRLDLVYLGYAVQEWGLDEEEVQQYGEELYRVWERVGKQAPQLPEEFTRFEMKSSSGWRLL